VRRPPIPIVGQLRPITRCRRGLPAALYVVGVCLNRIGAVRSPAVRPPEASPRAIVSIAIRLRPPASVSTLALTPCNRRWQGVRPAREAKNSLRCGPFALQHAPRVGQVGGRLGRHFSGRVGGHVVGGSAGRPPWRARRSRSGMGVDSPDGVRGGHRGPQGTSEYHRVPPMPTNAQPMPTKRPLTMRHHTTRTEVLAAARIRAYPAYLPSLPVNIH
jgi:hypothetical protein